MYPGSNEDWNKGKQYPLMDFFGCEVFFTLLAMGVVLLPFLYYPLVTWPKQCTYLPTTTYQQLLHTVMVPSYVHHLYRSLLELLDT